MKRSTAWKPFFFFARVYFWALYCIPLVYTSICVPVLYCLDYYRVVAVLKSESISPPNLFFFFRELFEVMEMFCILNGVEVS